MTRKRRRCGYVLILAVILSCVSEPLLQVPYPLVSLVTRLPQSIHGLSPLTIRTRTFETLTLSFKSEKDVSDVFESIKELTVASTCT